MTLLVPWLAFPLTLGVLSWGCGQLAARTVARGLPDSLRLPLGFAAIVVVGGLTTLLAWTAPLTTPVVAALAAAGLALSGRPHLRRLPRWAGAACAAAFLAYGAPVLLSGSATFAGYVKLDDTATFLAITDRTLEHGRDLTGLAPSSYEATLAVNLANGYPTGAFVPLGIGSQLVRSDPAWTFQPYLAFLGALLALSLYSIASGLVRAGWLRAVIAVVASQPALLYGFSLWGGAKEMFAAALLALGAAGIRDGRSRGSMLVSVTAAAALLDGLSAGALTWLAPLAICACVLLGRRTPLRRLATEAGTLGVLALPALAAAPAFLRSANRSTFEDPNELGNLLHPLSALQVLGIWPAHDFRWDPPRLRATQVLLAVTAMAAAAGIVLAIRRRSWALVAYAATCLVGAAIVAARGSPWLDAKTYAVASPALVLAALAAASLAILARRRVEGMLLLAAVAGGVLWSNVLAYRGVSLAPRDELAELQAIGSRFAGDGPALMTEYEPYGVRHFLRRLDAEGASELRRREVPLRSRRLLAKAEYADLDDFALDGILVYRTLVLRQSPVESRPPFPYQRVWSGSFYDVWQQRPDAPTVVDDVPLGTATQPAGAAPCTSVSRLAQEAQAVHGELAAVAARAAIAPAANGSVRVPQTGRYSVWIGGSFARPLAVEVDRHRVATAQPRLLHAGSYVRVRVIRLSSGLHRIRLVPESLGLRPGGGMTLLPLYTFVLTAAGPPPRPFVVPPSRARELCGRRLDWVEALRTGI